MILTFVISGAAIALELAVLLLLVRNNIWHEYSFFAVYAVWLLIGNSVLIITDVYFRSAYATTYWYIDSLDIVFRLLVLWEVFRQVFPKGSALSRSLSKGLGCVALGLLAIAYGTFWIYQNNPSLPSDFAERVRAVHLALDRSFGFVQALMMFGTLVVARYYGLKFGRNVRGIALGFGAWASISTADNALVAMTSVANFLRSFFSYMRPLSFVVMLIVWVWALWVYEPNPPIKESEGLELSRWTEDWNRTISTARKLYGHD
jgi:hypothetical protein